MSWLWLLQIAADAVLIGALAVLLLKLKSQGPLPQNVTPAKLKQFIEEAESLSKEFDRLLNEKRELVNSTLASLDARIRQLKETAADIPSPAPAADRDYSADAMQVFREKVQELAGQGMKPAQIAQAIGRPRGEVELVLKLSPEAGAKGQRNS